MVLLLIQPKSLLQGREIIPPLGLLKAAAIPDKNGYEVKILDGDLEGNNNIKKEIKKYDPEFVGFTTFTGPMLKDCLDLSKFVKENTSAKVIWGGVHASLLPQQVIQEKDVDIVVQMEGDYTLNNILENKNSLEKVKGIVYKKDGKPHDNGRGELIRDLDALPITPWHLVDVRKYYSGWADAKKTLTIMTSRGCPFRCLFCYNNKFNESKWRFNSIGRAKEEIESLASNYPIDGLRVVDDNFIGYTKEIGRAIEISKCLKSKDLRWSCLLRVDQVSKDLLRRFRDNGCNYVFYGAESGSQRILNFIRKGITVEQIVSVIRATNELNMRSGVGFIYDNPTETMDDLRQTFSLIRKIKAYVSYTSCQPFPGTSLYQYCVEQKLFKAPPSTKEWGNFDYTKIHGLSKVPIDFLKTLNNRYNKMFNIGLAMEKGDMNMLFSMGKIFLESLIRGLSI
jgi:anaerobic magnesium-protoporphyrin IX monomethyl ester cyclase